MRYTVKPGDSLSIIARDVLGNIDFWPHLASQNNIPAPYVIYPGQTLNITPPAGVVPKPSGSAPNALPVATEGGGSKTGKIVLWLLVVGLVGGAGYVYWKKRKSKKGASMSGFDEPV